MSATGRASRAAVRQAGRSEVRRWLAGREAVRWAERKRGRRAGAGLLRGRERGEWASGAYGLAGPGGLLGAHAGPWKRPGALGLAGLGRGKGEGGTGRVLAGFWAFWVLGFLFSFPISYSSHFLI